MKISIVKIELYPFHAQTLLENGAQPIFVSYETQSSFKAICTTALRQKGGLG